MIKKKPLVSERWDTEDLAESRDQSYATWTAQNECIKQMNILFSSGTIHKENEAWKLHRSDRIHPFGVNR